MLVDSGPIYFTNKWPGVTKVRERKLGGVYRPSYNLYMYTSTMNDHIFRRFRKGLLDPLFSRLSGRTSTRLWNVVEPVWLE